MGLHPASAVTTEGFTRASTAQSHKEDTVPSPNLWLSHYRLGQDGDEGNGTTALGIFAKTP